MPCSPTSCSASFTSSSLNGLMTASIFFMRVPRAGAAGRIPSCCSITGSAHAATRGDWPPRVACRVPPGKSVACIAPVLKMRNEQDPAPAALGAACLFSRQAVVGDGTWPHPMPAPSRGRDRPSLKTHQRAAGRHRDHDLHRHVRAGRPAARRHQPRPGLSRHRGPGRRGARPPPTPCWTAATSIRRWPACRNCARRWPPSNAASTAWRSTRRTRWWSPRGPPRRSPPA